MAIALLGMGSNLGDRAANLALAVQEIAALPNTRWLRQSSTLETEPVGPVPQGKFLNAAGMIETTLDVHALHAALKQIEMHAGREPAASRVRWGPRTLDLDLLFYDDLVLQTPGLTVPHPRLHERSFVLVPLAEISPEFVHPLLKRSVMQMLEQVEHS